MSIARMDNVGIVVVDLDKAEAFFAAVEAKPTSSSRA